MWLLPPFLGYQVNARIQAMNRYAVFFSGKLGSGIIPVQAQDPGHAEDIVRADHPDACMSVIDAKHLEGINKMKVLLAWVEFLDSGHLPEGWG